MKLKAKFGEVELEIESDNTVLVSQYYASWYGLVRKVIDEEAEMPKETPVPARETHH